jgi:hypothetical protein
MYLRNIDLVEFCRFTIPRGPESSLSYLKSDLTLVQYEIRSVVDNNHAAS